LGLLVPDLIKQLAIGVPVMGFESNSNSSSDDNNNRNGVRGKEKLYSREQILSIARILDMIH
jgi:hypothetical protein